MSKRLGMKVALAIAALGAMTLLQGCNEDEGRVIGWAWAPMGSVPLTEFGLGVVVGGSGSGQTTTTTAGAGGTP